MYNNIKLRQLVLSFDLWHGHGPSQESRNCCILWSNELRRWYSWCKWTTINFFSQYLFFNRMVSLACRQRRLQWDEWGIALDWHVHYNAAIYSQQCISTVQRVLHWRYWEKTERDNRADIFYWKFTVQCPLYWKFTAFFIYFFIIYRRIQIQPTPLRN